MAARCADGALEFHDLLVLARRLLREHQEVRRALHQRYTHLLLDEFQDTDPIQLELAVRITAAPDDQPADHNLLRPLPGRLMVVGDPKQSIYRFRRADIAQFMRAEKQIGAQPAPPVGQLPQHGVGDRLGEPHDGQADRAPARCAAALPGAHRGPRPRSRSRHGHRARRHAAHGDDDDGNDAEALREHEAADVAAVVVQALSEGWPVWREGVDGAAGGLACTPGDIAILLPSRLSLAASAGGTAALPVSPPGRRTVRWCTPHRRCAR